MEGMWHLEVQVIRWVQGLGAWLLLPMQVLSFMGTVEFYLAFMPAVYWCWDAVLGLRLGWMLMISAGLNEALKLAFHRPRPYWILSHGMEVHASSADVSFALPSGHAQNTLSLWGLVAASRKRRAAWAAALALAFLIGISRIYLGVHSPADILAGWAVGALVLVVFLRCQAAVADFVSVQSFREKVVDSLALSFGLLALSGLARARLANWELPAAWAETAYTQAGVAVAPLTLQNAVDLAGMLLGMGTGAAWLAERGGFLARGPATKRLVRYLVGLSGVLVLWVGSKALLPHGESLLILAFRYARSVMIGGWVSGVAPALFVRLRLAERKG